MRGYLLDTAVALWAVGIPERVPAPVRAAINRGPAFLSVIAYWEVMLKSMKGSLDVGDPRQWWNVTLDSLGLIPLVLRPEHIAEIHTLPPIHQDPFDRALIAQASVEELVLLTTDSETHRYANGRFRVIS